MTQVLKESINASQAFEELILLVKLVYTCLLLY